MSKPKITQQMRYRESLIKYARKHGVSKASRVYNVNRGYIYRWKNRYDGTIYSLANLSRKPLSHPNMHTLDELKLIKDMFKRNKDTGLVVLWIKLRNRGYTRSVSSLYNQLKKLNLKFNNPKKKKKKTKPKPYIQMTFPGERVQIDVKTVPSKCIVHHEKLYQYTAIDEFSRFRYLKIYNEKSTYTSYKFLLEVIKYFPFKIYTVRTDNGTEFTNRLLTNEIKKTIFEHGLEKNGIAHDLIKPYTPRHNGKVERSHRKDNERFYASHRFYSLDDANKQLKVYLKEYNNFPMQPLKWKSPNELLRDYFNKLK